MALRLCSASSRNFNQSYTNISYSQAVNWLHFEGRGFKGQGCRKHFPKCIFKGTWMCCLWFCHLVNVR